MIAAATLAVGSAAFAAVPATAATASGVTRGEVLAAASALRADRAQQIDPSAPTQSALDVLAAKVCGPNVLETFAQPVETPNSVDGLAVTSLVPTVTDSSSRIPTTSCSFTAIATLDGRATFSGEAHVFSANNFGPIGIESTISAAGQPSFTSNVYSLSSNVFVSPAVIESGYSAYNIQAEGLVKGPDSQRVLTSVKIADKKSKAEKKAAKKAYSKRTKAIKKSFAKAKRKAGSNAEKKAVARMTYATRRASAKAAYRYAVADYKLVNQRTKVADERRFLVKAYAAFPI
ncbi:hypothetical protein DX116_05495 [Aeromicrobium endophyticum]|uniref:Uncharacterized protein n=1 Tax=Aeromicrobium endophyticum TaxID=2292704 RepID=A0A371PAU1_9ACTN|nr:hypothetical protein DX116_05495 [Aeromicrobium endophyticum]